MFKKIFITLLSLLFVAPVAMNFTYAKDEVKQETEGTTSLIVPDEEPKERKLFKKKNKKVKDVKAEEKEDKEKDDE